MHKLRPIQLAALAAALVLFASACGGSEVIVTEVADPVGAGSTESPTTAPTAAPEPTQAPTPAEEPTPEPTTDPEPTAAPEPEPTATAAPEPTPSPFDDLPAGEPLSFLASESGSIDAVAGAADLWASAWRTDADPSQLAHAIVGFPFDLSAPVDGQVFSLLGETDYDEDDGVWETRWRYGVEASEFPELMADDDNQPIGPAVEVIYNETVPRFLASGLELQNTANTKSDRHPSGIASFQIYFRPDGSFAVPAGGLEGDLDTMAALMSVNLDGGDDIDGDTSEPGYLIGGSAAFDQAPAGLPLVGVVHDLLNVPSSMTMTRGRITSDFADPAVEGDNGTPILLLSMTYEGPASEFDAVVAALAEPSADSTQFTYGEIVDGVLEPDTFELGLSTASTDLLLMNRHTGSMSAWLPDPEDERFEINVRLTLSTNDLGL